MKENIRYWLRENISDPFLISSSFIFGSFLGAEEKFSDVDVMIVFKNWMNRDWIKLQRNKFYSDFKTPLHIQGFHLSQTHEITEFMRRNSEIEEIKHV